MTAGGSALMSEINGHGEDMISMINLVSFTSWAWSPKRQKGSWSLGAIPRPARAMPFRVAPAELQRGTSACE